MTPSYWSCACVLQFKLMLSEDGSGKGAALVAAVANRIRDEHNATQASGGNVWRPQLPSPHTSTPSIASSPSTPPARPGQSTKQRKGWWPPQACKELETVSVDSLVMRRAVCDIPLGPSFETEVASCLCLSLSAFDSTTVNTDREPLLSGCCAPTLCGGESYSAWGQCQNFPELAAGTSDCCVNLWTLCLQGQERVLRRLFPQWTHKIFYFLFFRLLWNSMSLCNFILLSEILKNT